MGLFGFIGDMLKESAYSYLEADEAETLRLEDELKKIYNNGRSLSEYEKECYQERIDKIERL